MTRNRAEPCLFQRGTARFAPVVLLGCLALPGSAGAQVVDTSEWLCEFCPFEGGARSDVTAGVTTVSDDSAWIGDATGLDEEGVYAAVDSTGSYAADRYRLRWSVEDLGVDARSAELEGGTPGRHEYRFGYRELPRRRFITTSTVFIQESDLRLGLPGAWARAPTTGGMTALATSLEARAIASDRSLLNVGGSVELLEGFSLEADYRRHEHDGLKIRAGSLFTSASLLPMPFDYRTDEAELAIHYADDRANLSLGWYLSDFGNLNGSLAWQSPFTTQPGAETLRMARAPDNNFQQLRLSGGLALPDRRTWLRFSAASGRIEQDQAFLPYTINPNIVAAALPMPNLGGEVDTNNVALAITTSPLPRTQLRLSFRNDERDNQTTQVAWSRVIVDTFASGEIETNIPYSIERSTLSVEADYNLGDSSQLSVGVERRELDRDFQEVAEQSEDTRWGRVRWHAQDGLELDVRAGAARREIDRYDETLAMSLGQNPLLRKYNLAFRYREFGELAATWSPLSVPVSLAISARLTDDSYTRSALGMTAGKERLLALDFGWTPSERASFHAGAGFDRIESSQLGSESFGMPDWQAEYEDRFRSFSAGLRVREIAERVDLEFDYLHSEGSSEIGVHPVVGAPSAFPDLESTFDLVRAAVDWRRSDKLTIRADLRWQQFETEDWALQGVAPDTIPVVLTLGAKPWIENVLIFTVLVRYRFNSGGET